MTSMIAHRLLSAYILLGLACGSCTTEQTWQPNEDNADSAVPSSWQWPNGQVYLLVEPGFYEAELSTSMLIAKFELEEETGIQVHFIDRPEEAKHGFYAVLKENTDPETDGSASLGLANRDFMLVGILPKIAQTPVVINISNNLHTVRHELGHLVGLNHTHSRLDRDEHITVHESFIKPNFLARYDLSPNDFRLIGPYDTKSVMHYSSRGSQNDEAEKRDCQTISKGTNDGKDCITSDDSRSIKLPLEYTDWNYSVLAALYCDERFCQEGQCADEEQCNRPEVQKNLQRLYDWEGTEEGLRQASRFPHNVDPAPIYCDSSIRSHNVQDVNDCDASGQPIIGSVETSSSALIHYQGTDTLLCNADPSVDIVSGDVEVCMYLACSDESAESSFSCPAGTYDHSLDLAEGQANGCCGTEDFSIVDLDCSDTTSDDADVYMRVKANTDSDTESCETFSLVYHY